MDDISTERLGRFPAESADARATRLRHEAALIAEADQDIADGKVITGAELDRFLKWFGSDEEGPPPDNSDAA